MRGEVDRIRSAGAELVVVGNGQPWQAEAFRKQMKLDAPVFVDPSLEAYKAAGLRRGARGLLGVSVLGNAVRALRDGHRQGAVQGDAWQLGGVLVVRPDGSVPFAHVHQKAGELTAADDVLAAL